MFEALAFSWLRISPQLNNFPVSSPDFYSMAVFPSDFSDIDISRRPQIHGFTASVDLQF